MKFSLSSIDIGSNAENSGLIAERFRILAVQVKQDNARRLKAIWVRDCAKNVRNSVRLPGTRASNDRRVTTCQSVEIQVSAD